MSPKARIRIAWRNRHWTHDQKIDRAFAGGLTMVALGCGFIYWPLFFIVGGVLLTTVAWKYGTAAPAGTELVDEREID